MTQPTQEEVEAVARAMTDAQAKLYGLVCAFHTAWMEREGVIRDAKDFAGIERAADIMDSVWDRIPELLKTTQAALVDRPSNEAALRDALAGIQWRSVEKDNMEFGARITYVQMERIVAALKSSPHPSNEDRLREAVTVFLAKFDECEPHLADAALIRHIHVGPYTGPQFGKELQDLRKALKSSEGDG